MNTRNSRFCCVIGLLAGISLRAGAAVRIVSVTPSPRSPQRIGRTIRWSVIATDSNAGPLTFRFNVAPPGGALALIKDFNVGKSRSGIWMAQPFDWTPTGIEGTYQIQVEAKDFKTGESASKTVTFQVDPLVTSSSPVVIGTSNALVALFSAPSCPAGSTMRVSFQARTGSNPATTTNYMNCHPPNTMTFEIGGMYATTTYDMFSQTNTNGKITNGPTVSFTTGAWPRVLPLPTFTVKVPPGPKTDTVDSVILNTFGQFGGQPSYPDVATDLSGKVIWYYNASGLHTLARPLQNGNMLTLQSGAAWDLNSTILQYLREVDLAGNIIRETNTGIVEQELLALGARDAGPCTAIPKPAAVGAACLGAFHHDAIQTLPNGYTAAIADIEKIYPSGTQGDTTGLPVDVIGDIIFVMDTNWQVVWYFDTFQHAGGPPQLDINRPAVLNEICTANEQGCPPVFLLGSGIAPQAKDWLHVNSLYYWPESGDIVFSARHQDWVMKIDYQNGSGTGNILWRMGACGDFTLNNIYNDSWPWFSHQHEAGFEGNGAGALTLFDNGNTRVSPPSGPGSSTGCMPGLGNGNSRGMALTVDESKLQVTPVVSMDLGVYSNAGGSAQLLFDGNYYFEIAVVLVNLTTEDSYSVEFSPTPGTPNGTQVYNLQGPVGYRGWQMPSLYNPPIT